MKITAEIVNGKCPTCDEFTMLVGLTTVYRCMNCGTDLEQHVNGKISYLPTLRRSDITTEKFRWLNVSLQHLYLDQNLVNVQKTQEILSNQ